MLVSVLRTKIWELVLLSVAYIFMFLSGYIPVAVHAILLSLLFCTCFYYFIVGKKSPIMKIRVFVFRLGLPLFIASVVVVPLYIAILLYNKTVLPAPVGMWFAVFELPTVPFEFWVFFSRAFATSTKEQEIFSLGLIPIIIFILGCSNKYSFLVKKFDNKLIVFSLLVFIFHLLLSFRITGLPILFYYLVPALGKMHIYERYLPVPSFFFFLSVTILIKHIRLNRLKIKPKNLFVFLIVLAFILLLLLSVKPEIEIGGCDLGRLSFELLITFLAIVGLLYLKKKVFIIVIIMLPFFINVSNYYSSIMPFNMLKSATPHANSVALVDWRTEVVNNYFKANSNKILIKYADLTLNVDRPGGIMLNYPWVAQNENMHLSNYMGYELHLGIDYDYFKIFPWFGLVSSQWLINTGADYIIYDKSAWKQYYSEFTHLIDNSVPPLDIGNGYTSLKLKQLNNKLINGYYFDNGMIRVASSSVSTSVINFKTNYSSFISFDVDAKESAIITYLLFPSKLMEMRVDNKPVITTFDNGLLQVNLATGKHKVEYVYKNRIHSLFLWTISVYIVLIILILVLNIVIIINRRLKITNRR